MRKLRLREVRGLIQDRSAVCREARSTPQSAASLGGWDRLVGWGGAQARDCALASGKTFQVSRQRLNSHPPDPFFPPTFPHLSEMRETLTNSFFPSTNATL